jgi:hypothetical protein
MVGDYEVVRERRVTDGKSRYAPEGPRRGQEVT